MNKTKFMHMGRMLTMMLVVLLFASCSKKDKYCSAIPNDAPVLFRIDAQSFIKAHDIDIKSLTNMIGAKDGELDNIGIDCDSPIYGFVTLKGATGFVAAVKDADALTNLAKTYGPLAGAKVSDKQDLHWIEASGSLIAYDDSRLLFMSGGGMNMRKDMVALMGQDEEASILSTTLFAHLSEVKQPLALITSANVLDKASNGQFAASMKLAGKNIDDFDLDILATFDCVKDKAIFAVDYLANTDAVKANIEKNVECMSNISGKFLSAGIENPVMWGAFNMDGAKYFDSIMKSMGDKIPAGSADIALVEKIMKSFAGDICFEMPEIGEKFLVQAEVKNADALVLVDSLVSMTQGNVQAISTGKDAYCLSNRQSETPVFVGVKDNTLYIANSTEATAAVNKAVETGLESKKDEITKSAFYFTMDMNKVVPMLLPKMERGMGVMLAGRLSKLDRFNAVFTLPGHMEFTLSVKDGKDFVEEMLK